MSGKEDQRKEESAPPPPTVFISYSHDSPEHKMWVAGLAQDLRRLGVNAVLDQWELTPGQDVPSFMENGIRDANRVCIICTPEYARKANAGAGGVGYEKMIVTGELYANLGSDKFVPLIAKGSKAASLPTFLSTRLFIDFRNTKEYEEKLEELIRELHKVPKNLKPPIGPNPFLASGASETSAVGSTASIKVPPISIAGATERSPEEVYQMCGELIRSHDLMGWRQLAKALRISTTDNLLAWREKYDKSRPTEEATLLAAVDDGLRSALPLMTMALAGVESRLPEYVDQRSVLDDLLAIPGWSKSGLVTLVQFPYTLGYLFHYLHGAVALSTGQVRVATSMATMTCELSSGGGHVALWLNHDLTGYPKSLGGNCAEAWEYLKSLSLKYPFIDNLFGRPGDFLRAVCAYSMVLCAIDLANTLKHENGEAIASGKGDAGTFSVVPLFTREDAEVDIAAFRMAFRDRENLTAISEVMGVSPDTMRRVWPHWIGKIAHGFRHFEGRFSIFRAKEWGLDELP